MGAKPINYISVLFPLALPGLYSYKVPDELKDQIQFGIRVEVPLKNRLYAAIVVEMHETLDLKYKARFAISVLDEVPIISPQQYKFWTWLSSYYACTMGEVMQVALPSGLKLSSETRLILHSAFKLDELELDDREYLIVEALAIQKELSIDQVQAVIQQKSVHPILRKLLQRGIILIQEELKRKYKPKKAVYIKLASNIEGNNEAMSAAFDAVKRSEKQTRVLLNLLSVGKSTEAIPRRLLIKNTDTDSSVIRAMIKKGILESEERSVSRIKSYGEETQDLSPLSEVQIQAVKHIEEGLSEGKVCLLHGVTGSGKTRIYMELIQKWTAEGGQVLLLIPEIALTTHIVARLQHVFGDDLGLYHSKISQHERVELWNAVKNGKILIVGARSGLFLPFENLKGIIIDESHDQSYKQHDPTPRYNARDAGIFLASQLKIPILLGTATPSLESYAHGISGKYKLIPLMERHGEAIMPEIRLVDLKKAYASKRMNGSLSQDLCDAIQVSLDANEQVILFQNRRGFAPILKCDKCDWKAECINCDVSLTYHKHLDKMRCHHCSYQILMPEFCPACGNEHIRVSGTGTQKIEDEIINIFPEASVRRFDYDTANTKASHSEILEAFEHREIDILVGTQMVTKGLDFEHISLVGVIEADRLIHFPDFRSYERAYQLLTQVSGRAGRKKKQGVVIIQSFEPEHPIIQDVIRQDYPHFFNREIQERKNFYYPPFSRLIKITLKHRKSAIVDEVSLLVAMELRKQLAKRVIGPSLPAISRVRNLYIRDILIKMENRGDIILQAKKLIHQLKEKVQHTDGFKSVRISLDVDPM